jgi:hypothetical protein
LTGTYYQEPPEAQSIKSMLHIARILAIIFGIILFLGGLAWAATVAYFYSVCSTLAFDNYCGAGLGFLLIGPILILIWGVVDVIIYVQMKSIEALVNARQYEQAKSKTLLWMILGFIIGGILLGIILLIAYIKFDPLINSQRAMTGQAPPVAGGWAPAPGAPPAYGAPPPQYAAPAAPQPPPPPMAAAAAPTVPFCPNCGKPGTWVPQYGRFYCYDDKQYL